KTADKIWRRMVTAGTYAFNVAHCVSYAMLGFWAMWLKVHHPLAFYAAQLHKTAGDEGKQLALMRDLMDKRYGRSYKVFPPDVKKSRASWKPVEGGVLAGFEQMPGVAGKTAKSIMDFIDEVEVNEWKDLMLV